jgi:hypothetical protein
MVVFGPGVVVVVVQPPSFERGAGGHVAPAVRAVWLIKARAHDLEARDGVVFWSALPCLCLLEAIQPVLGWCRECFVVVGVDKVV